MATGVMRAAILDGLGLPFRIAPIERPQPGRGQVLVRIKASAVNPLDLKIRAGEAAHARQPLPAILGIDLAGTVEVVGPDVSAFREGDNVYGMAGGVGGLQGSLAEFSAVDARLLAPKPANLTMHEAAALPLAFITAWEGLVDRAGVRAGDKVLVHGGAGGVGHIAIQISRAFDATTFATGSAESMAFIAELGATPINYRDTAIEAYVAKYTDGDGFDIVYDTVGGATLDSSFTAVKRFGHVVSALGWARIRSPRSRSAPHPIPASLPCFRC
jgi:NADPH:quinone reductase